MTLNTGSYNCTYTVAGGGKSIGFVASGGYTQGGGSYGYGFAGRTTTLTLGSTTFNAEGGCPGGPSGNNNIGKLDVAGNVNFKLGGGCGTRIDNTISYLGAIGTIYDGGGNPYIVANGIKGGGGGGASPYENGVSSSSTAGARGGRGIASSTLNAPFNNFSPTSYLYSNGSTYFCEGGGGASVIRTIPSEMSYYGIGGRGSYGSPNIATSGAANTGSGGGALLYGDGTYSGTGANGGIIIAF